MSFSARPPGDHPADHEALFLSPAEGFRRLADTYDSRLAGNPVLVVESAAALYAMPDLVGMEHVADIGCGTGRYALQMVRLGATRVTGVDIALEMLQVAARKAQRSGDNPPIRWECGDLYERLPFEDSVIDAAVCGLVLSFLPDLVPAFQEITRVLKPGGYLVISDQHPHGLCAARAASLAVQRKDGAPYLRFTSHEGEECRIQQHPHLLSTYITAAQQAGLMLEHIGEPVADRRLATTYGAGLHDQIGIPLAFAMRFRKKADQ